VDFMVIPELERIVFPLSKLNLRIETGLVPLAKPVPALPDGSMSSQECVQDTIEALSDKWKIADMKKITQWICRKSGVKPAPVPDHDRRHSVYVKRMLDALRDCNIDVLQKCVQRCPCCTSSTVLLPLVLAFIHEIEGRNSRESGSFIGANIVYQCRRL
jgi:hypothetical protein